MHTERFKGAAAALVTPFKADGSIDFEGLKALLDHTGPHLNYWVINGTTAESPTLSTEEKHQILDFVQVHNPYERPIVFGMGGYDTLSIVRSLKETDLSGVAAILSVSPHYNRPTQEGIIRHYEAIADAAPVPVILYNVPARTASNMTAATTLQLAEHPNIIGIKEAAGDISQAMQIAKYKPDDFLLLSGDDVMTVPMISFGAAGVISVLANALPEHFAKVTWHALNGQFGLASDEYLRLLDLNRLLFEEGNPAGVKAALAVMKVCGPQTRLPLVPASEALTDKIRAQLHGLGLC